MKTSIAAFALLFALVLPFRPALAQDPLELPVIGVVPVDTLRVDTSGIRGLAISRSGVWILTSDHTGRSVADSPYSSAILSWDPSTGEVREILRERDSFSTGLAWDGQSLWAGGNRVGGLEAIYRIEPGGGLADETIPSSGYHPGGLAWGDDYLWQVDSTARQVSRIETEEGKLSRRLQPPGYFPTGLAHDGANLFVADAATGTVFRMNARSGRAEGVLDPEVMRFTGEFVTLAWSGGYLWAVRDTDRYVVRYQLVR